MTKTERYEVEKWCDRMMRTPYRPTLVVDDTFYDLLRRYASERDDVLGFAASRDTPLRFCGRLVVPVPDWELPFGEEIVD